MQVFGLGEEPGVPRGTPKARGEHANATHTERESKPQHRRYEANMLNNNEAVFDTKKPCTEDFPVSDNIKLHLF